MTTYSVKNGKRMTLATVLLLVSVLFLTCVMTLGVAAANDTYSLKLEITLYDEVGDEWIQTVYAELPEGEAIDPDALIAQYPELSELLADAFLTDEGYTGIPDDDKMPASDLTLTATYEYRPYTVTWMIDGVAVPQKMAYGRLPAFEGTPIKAADAQYTYTFAGWDTEIVEVTEDATYTALFDATVNKYTVTWIVDGNTTTEQVEYGQVPAFAGSTDKAPTAQYTYTFKGWDKEIVAVVGDATYTAQYDSAVNEYTVTWVVDGNTTTETYKYGETPSFKGSTDKAATAQYTYTFKGWDKEIVAVAGDATYTAQYDSTVNEYTVTWVVDGNTTTETYKYGETPSFKGSTDKAATAQYTYTFKGWDKALAAVEGDVTYTARYTETVKTYTVTFNYGDGKTETVTVEYGKGAQAPTNTDKAATEEYTYTFKGWDADFSKITADLTVNAQYEQTPVKAPETEPDTDEPVTSEPDTSEPDTSEPDTSAPDTNEPGSSEPDTPAVTDPDTDEPEVTNPESTAPDSEPDTAPVTGDDGCGGNWWWIILVIVVAAGAAVAVIILLRRKGEPETTEPETKPEPKPEPEPEPEAPVNTAPLFIPLGEEIPEEEIPEEVETVDEVDAEHVDELMTDKTAEHLLIASDEMGGVGKMGIINVGLISAAYQAGETVDLASLQEKGMIDGNVGRLKVLASGTLDKPLTIKADAFSVQAIKMITITGGQAIELKGE